MSEDQKFSYIYTCYDPLVWPEVIKHYYGTGHNFFSADPGAVKNILDPHKEGVEEFILWRMKIAHEKLHKLRKIILVNHSRCGAYRLAGVTFHDSKIEEEFHKDQLEKAAAVIKKELPGVEIEIHYFLKEEQRMVW